MHKKRIGCTFLELKKNSMKWADGKGKICQKCKPYSIERYTPTLKSSLFLGVSAKNIYTKNRTLETVGCMRFKVRTFFLKNEKRFILIKTVSDERGTPVGF